MFLVLSIVFEYGLLGKMWLSIRERRVTVTVYSKTSNNGPSEKWTTSVQRTAHLPPIDFTIELIHYEPPRSGHLSIPNNGHGSAPMYLSLYKLPAQKLIMKVKLDGCYHPPTESRPVHVFG